MAAEYAESMRAVGIHPLRPTAAYHAIAAGHAALPGICAALDAARFSRINSAKGRWAFCEWLLMQAEASAAALALQLCNATALLRAPAT